jgi:hypothetical protein
MNNPKNNPEIIVLKDDEFIKMSLEEKIFSKIIQSFSKITNSLNNHQLIYKVQYHERYVSEIIIDRYVSIKQLKYKLFWILPIYSEKLRTFIAKSNKGPLLKTICSSPEVEEAIKPILIQLSKDNKFNTPIIARIGYDIEEQINLPA